MTNEEIEKKMRDMISIRTLLVSSIISAMALVVGLFWNDAIKSTIDQIVPRGDSLFYKYLAAVIVSIIVVTFIYIIMHGQRLAEKRMENLYERINRRAKRKGVSKAS